MVNHRKYPLLTCDLYLGVRVTQNVARYPLHHITYAPAKLKLLRTTVKEEMYLQENTLYDIDLGVKVTYNVSQYSTHHVIYAPAKFEVAKSNRLGDKAFARKYII